MYRKRSKIAFAYLTGLSACVPADAQVVPPGYVVSAKPSAAPFLSQPVTCTFINHNDLLVAQKFGSVVRVLDGVRIDPPVLTLAVHVDSEQGLLGIARHPDFTPAGGFVYLYYTNAAPIENRITRFTWDGSTLSHPAPIATIAGPLSSVHNGGIILFGPDRKLYAIIGDLGRAGQTQNYQFSPTLSDSSVVLRLNDDGSTPLDNPFAAQVGWERFYAYGIRNSFGMAFDELTGTLWDSENGPDHYDEVNRVFPGFNSGWVDLMGPDARDQMGVADLLMIPKANYADPAFNWYEPVVPTAIRFLHSVRFDPAIRDSCFVADGSGGNLNRFDLNAKRTGFILKGGLVDTVADNPAERDSVRWGTGFGGLTDLQLGPDGFLYAVSLSSGRIYKIRPEFPMGDLNEDGSLDAIDRAAFINLLLGLPTVSANPKLADFDGNGTTDGADTQSFIESYLMPQ